MKEVKIRGREIALHLIMGGDTLVREDKDEAGHKVYIFFLEDWRLDELRIYVNQRQKRCYY